MRSRCVRRSVRGGDGYAAPQAAQGAWWLPRRVALGTPRRLEQPLPSAMTSSPYGLDAPPLHTRLAFAHVSVCPRVGARGGHRGDRRDRDRCEISEGADTGSFARQNDRKVNHI